MLIADHDRAASSLSFRASAGRRYPIRVKDRLDVADPGDAGAERLGVPHLDDEAVLDHRVYHRAARLQDIDAVLGKRPREVLEQAMAVPAVHLELDPERGRGIAVPRHRREALRVLHEGQRVRTMLV